MPELLEIKKALASLASFSSFGALMFYLMVTARFGFFARFILAQHKQARIVCAAVYVDAAHETSAALRDMTAYWPLLKPGGGLVSILEKPPTATSWKA